MQERESSVGDPVFFTAFGCWVGTPVIEWQGRVLDGRRRLACYQLSVPPPRVVAKTMRDAGRLLALAGHPERAVELLGESVSWDESLSVWLRLPPWLVAPLLAARAKLNREQRRKPPRKGPSFKRERVVRRLRQLLASVEQGHVEATPDQLRWALGPWAED